MLTSLGATVVGHDDTQISTHSTERLAVDSLAPGTLPLQQTRAKWFLPAERRGMGR